jgi:hypothetical protein
VWRCHGGAGCFGASPHRVDVGACGDEGPQAELATLRPPGEDLGILGELAARAEGERQLALELEHHDVPGRLCVIAEELGAGYARGVDAERGPVEGKRPLKIGDRQRDDVDASAHASSDSLIAILRSMIGVPSTASNPPTRNVVAPSRAMTVTRGSPIGLGRSKADEPQTLQSREVRGGYMPG